MKKIIFLMLIMGVFSPLINAYEYKIYDADSVIIEQFYTDSTGNLNLLRVFKNGNLQYLNDLYYIYASLRSIKISSGNEYITSSVLDSYYKGDLNFLNDLYTSNFLMPFLNYLYNDASFNYNEHIEYTNYQILYNDDGLAVESIVNGVWAGLYSDSNKSKSGALYNKNGSLIYYNGKEVTPVTSFLVWLQKFTKKVVIETFEEIQRSLISGIIAAVVLVLAIVRFVLELLPSSITPRRRRYYGGGRGSLSDYGDGSQVAASVRARLAAKNRALKARAYDRSGVEQSLQNSILFDLENDR